jgi:phosphatidylethanolamine/phosphatidyl-N-methylethanolamine N-methyltransferase
VLVPGGQLLLLEHVLSKRALLRAMMRLMNPLVLRLWGAHLDRDTVRNVEAAGFCDISAQALSLDIIEQIEARSPSPTGP